MEVSKYIYASAVSNFEALVLEDFCPVLHGSVVAQETELVPNQKSAVWLRVCQSALWQYADPHVYYFLVKYNSANNKITQTTI